MLGCLDRFLFSLMLGDSPSCGYRVFFCLGNMEKKLEAEVRDHASTKHTHKQLSAYVCEKDFWEVPFPFFFFLKVRSD